MKKTNQVHKFISLDEIVEKKISNKQFRKEYTEELSRLRLAHEIKSLREKKKMTQAEVAERAGMPQSVIARIESGSHSFSIGTLHRLAGVFNKKISLI